MYFCRLTIQEPIFSVSNTEFEGGDNGHGHGDCTFLVKQAQPSHNRPSTPVAVVYYGTSMYTRAPRGSAYAFGFWVLGFLLSFIL